MTKIKNYGLDGALSSGDKWIGTDENGNLTVNFSLGEVASYVIDQIEGGGVDDTQRITVRKVVVGSVIDGQGVADDDISKAVNRSFKGAINISKYEIVLFEVNRQVIALSGAQKVYKMLKEQYYWNGGEATINSDSTLDQFTLDYSVEITVAVDEPTKGGDTETAPIPSTDTSDPAGSVNAYTDILPLDDTAKNQYVALYDTVTETDYKFYRFSGAAGNYGAGPDTALPGDFTEVTQEEFTVKSKLSQFINDGDGTNPFATTDEIPTLQLADYATDSFTGTRASLVDSALHGFMVEKDVASGRVGYDAYNSTAGNSGSAGFVARSSANLYSEFIMLTQFASNYSVGYLQDRGAVHSDNKVYFLAGNTAGFSFKSGANISTLGAADWLTDLLTLDPGGAIIAPKSTATNIEAAGNKALTSIEWCRANLPQRASVELTAAQVRDLFNTKITIVPAQGPGTVIKVISAFAQLTYGTAGFDHTTGELILENTGASAGQMKALGLKSSVDVGLMFTPVEAQSDTDQLPPNSALRVTADSVATVGDSTVKIFVTFEVITI